MTPKVKGIIFSVILLVIALIMLPLVIDGVHDARTDTVVAEAFPGCVVAAGATDVVLAHDLYRGVAADVTAMTATGAGAVPAFDAWVGGTNTLTIDGLGADTPQDITVTYDYDAVGAFAGVGAITGLIPLLVVVGIIIVAIIYSLWALKNKE